ncbi:TATA-box-binding protein [Methanococcus aeolicus]|jgi:transcription initiation factor TFIID TATA-box-binding protein|uniref:TATA-box-binding protein n=1 Tax=Methanococcus aeolicus (strain ATCC BAA-1280 / DSM 17508 / OCM 812 / Nankai-3) TaxID=419665 RepID=TBP_META3|nr:TATA-box-binding protein [Methanococcus aeolicus]A6UTF6.1 RecName: Full=TATA-box-binding protein; AltName: Full=Box A-binding protein; Short=BAP; AltName: Full=TATA sequence-binding protein; Short=TBP; AltName: Full=TATA-box factor [Methanococcus aeolicus Nankai-3]ABR55778.1 TATA-box binding protein [Methanococcus aeolicus Nankai-3]UXM84116.1 TATA-box-binding protein [Methanococcus aeolicus]
MSSEIKIVNVVVSTKIGDDIDLEYVADVLDNSEYEPEQFPGLVCRLSDPKVALLIFRSGKLNCTGAKSKEDAVIAINKVMEYLREAGLDLIDTPEVKVQNMVATAELGMEPNLDDLSTLERTEYEPEQFPGLVYRMESPKVVLLVFGSGKVVITGLKNKEDAYIALEKIKNTVKELEEEYF